MVVSKCLGAVPPTVRGPCFQSQITASSGANTALPRLDLPGYLSGDDRDSVTERFLSYARNKPVLFREKSELNNLKMLLGDLKY